MTDHSTEYQPARTLDELYQTVRPEIALEADDPRYVDLSPGRGDEHPVAQIRRRITVSRPPDYHCSLLTGHRGSGKSTELHRLQAALEQDGFLVVYVDVREMLDLGDVEYLDVLLAIAQALDASARRHGIKLSENLLQAVSDWFISEEIITREEVHESERMLGTDYEVGLQVPLLARITATLTGKIQAGSVNRRLVRQKVEPKLEELLHNLRLLVDNVRERAKGKYKGPVIIVDSLDKMNLKVVDKEQGLTNHALLFVEHAEQLRSLPCHIVYTFPVSLLNDRNLNNVYDGVNMLPMVKVSTPEQEPWAPGRELLYNVVERRVVVDAIFEQPDLVYRLIAASGGVVRDLMHLLLFAADRTPLEGKIGELEVQKAINKLVRLYDHLIHEDDLPLLLQVSRDVYTGMSNALARLMYNRLVLPYVNGENWRDLHPAVRQAATFRAYLRGHAQVTQE